MKLCRVNSPDGLRLTVDLLLEDMCSVDGFARCPVQVPSTDVGTILEILAIWRLAMDG